MEAVIFDIYNTLFRNDTPSWLHTFREICRIQGLLVSPEELWRCWRSFEVRFRQTRTNLEQPEKSPPFKTYQAAWCEAFERAFEALQLHGDAAQAAQMAAEALSTREPYEDALPFLKYVTPRWKTAVLSNADNASLLPLLQRHQLSFDAVLTSEMVRAYKPHPLVFQRILEEIRTPPEEAIYVGDSLFDDVQGAKMAGMAAAWINRNGEQLDASLPSPDYQVTGLEELIQILEALKEGDP